MSNEPASIQDAPAPFSGVIDPENDNLSPDFVLKSNDGVDFYLHREILKYASRCFDMFAMPTGDNVPSDFQRDGKPVVVLNEPQSVPRQSYADHLCVEAYTVSV
ncbi:BTB domain-containing protein [Mycena venus]|uniref:BTB domain-containing protein n=1 Tax=Mycena venus TaxID=2733690 RepID=A0A8H6X5H6_9AGAR|nr:BTB domain-containing protein [Mycena venus]